MTPPINSVSPERLDELAQWAASEEADCLHDDMPISAGYYADIIKLIAARRAANTPVDGWVFDLKPMDSAPSGDEALEPDELNVHEGVWAIVYGTNAKPIGWIDTHATFAHRVYRDRVIASPALPSQVVGNASTFSLTDENGNVIYSHPTTSPAAEPVAWQPIETAPKTPSEVLLWGVMKGRTQPWKYIGSWFPHRDGGWWVAHAMPIHPTHWMPLPAAPALLAALPEREG